ncbi:MAG: 50S ribosomal protein L16 [Aquificae bacterium]|nr:50S ribosomal protein L16 [Aquificota bacterium]
MSLLQPKKLKWRKQHRGRMKGKANRRNYVAFGEYGLQALEPCWMTSRQIEAARIAIVREAKKGAKVWIRVFPHKPVTRKPAETRMGKGKGDLDHFVAVVKPGHILFEISGVPQEVAEEAFRKAGYKLPIKTRVVKAREEV